MAYRMNYRVLEIQKGQEMQTIGCDKHKGLVIYKNGEQVAQFNDTQSLAHLIAEASKALREKVNG